MFNELAILRVFFENPSKEFNVREVARLLKKAPATASKELKLLAKNRLLIEKKERRFNFYKSNIEDDAYRDLKIFYNIKKIKDSGLVEELNKFYLKPTIVLFGSLSKGIDTENSDIDLLIISEKKSDFNKKTDFEKKLGRPIQLFVVRDIKDLRNNYLISNVFNGIVLRGEIKWT